MPGGRLEVDALAVQRGGRRLFEAMSFTATPGTFVSIRGDNGAGKSSLLRVLAGLAPAAAGEVRYANEPIRKWLTNAMPTVMFHGHTDGLKNDLDAIENLEFYHGVAPSVGDSPGELVRLLEQTGLDPARRVPVRMLSAGQRKRVALARLRLSSAKIWILDEPYINLDGAGQDLINGWLSDFLAGGGIAVLASHASDPISIEQRIDILL